MKRVGIPSNTEGRTLWMDDDLGDTYKVVWRIPEVGERYFRSGQNHVATLRQPANSCRWVVLESLNGNNHGTSARAGRFTVQDGVRKVNLASRSWL